METQKDPACPLCLGLGSAILLQLAFLGESDPNFPWKKVPCDNKVYKIPKNKYYINNLDDFDFDQISRPITMALET